MEKQQKILNKIKFNCGQTTPLGTKPNDECYTSMTTIINELKHWTAKFKGKNILCPCDWDILDDSSYYYLRIEFKPKIVNGKSIIKSVAYKEYTDLRANRTEKLKVKDIDKFLREKIKCNFIRTFIEHAKEWGVNSITASGYNPATNKGIKFQDVNFSDFDICVTNPPFSQYGEFLNKLINSKIDFIILAPFLNRANPCIGLPLMLKQCYLGYGRRMSLLFDNPVPENKYKTKSVSCDWITSFSDAQDEIDKTRMHNGIKYEQYKDDYFFMENMTMKDGTHPIRAKTYSAIPDDYYGWVFSSVGVLDILSNNEFEWYITNAKKYLNQTNKSMNPFAHPASNKMVSNSNWKGFHGVILRRKKYAINN